MTPCFRSIASLFLLSFLFSPALGTTFEVTNPEEFQAALTAAESNGQFDWIYVYGGDYPITSTLTYAPGFEEDYGLQIEAELFDRAVLDGGGARRIMHLSGSAANANLSIRGIDFVNGNATGYGAGLTVDLDLAQVLVDFCRFYDNTVDFAGGGLSAGSNHGEVNLIGCEFERNTAGEDGGGASLWTVDGEINMQTSHFRDNVSTADDGAGAALTAEHGTIYVISAWFEDNVAGDDGGGLLAYSTLAGSHIELIDCDFVSNDAGLGGAGAFCRINGSGEVRVRDSRFESNTIVNGSGGGLFVWVTQGPVTVTTSSFTDNESLGEDGGGTWIWSENGTITLDRSLFAQNRAFRHGGGAMLAPDAGAVAVFNCIFASNESGEIGGGMNVSANATSLHSYNNVYYGNASVDGGGGLSYYSDTVNNPLRVTNDIYWLNTPDQIGNAGAGVLTVTYSDVQGSAGEPWFGAGCIDADPEFAVAAGEYFFLDLGSPCIDSADGSVAPDEDRYGNYRHDVSFAPNTGIGPPWADMGVSEVVPSAVSLEYFTLSAEPGRALARWDGRFTGEPGQFRLIGVAAQGPGWEVEYRRGSDGAFAAEDRCERLAGGGEIRYELHYREGNDEWTMLRSESVLVAPVVSFTALAGAYPNPFNPRTTVRFSLDEDQRIRLRVLDASGRHVTQLADGRWPRGEHELIWDGRDDGGRELATGVYLLQLEAAGKALRRKLVLLR